jgi:CHAD domain-containing protein
LRLRRVTPATAAEPIGHLLLASLNERWCTFIDLLRATRRRLKPKRVHDCRVATRRLIAILDLIGELTPSKAAPRLRKRLRVPLKQLGPLRDVQVQRGILEPLWTQEPSLEPWLDKRRKKLQGKAERRLAAVRPKKLRRLYRDLSGEVMVSLLSESLQDRYRAAAVEIVDAAFSRVIESRRALSASDLDTAHKLRVNFKKFRYMLEVLRPALSGVGETQLASMQAFQSMLGDVHDLDVLSRLLSARAKQADGKGSASLLAVQDDVSRRLLLASERVMAAADEIFAFWRHEWL